MVRIERYGNTDSWVKYELMERMTNSQKDIIEHSLTMTESLLVGLIDEKLACVLGLVPPTLMSNQVYIWLYTTEAAKEHQFTFARQSQILLQEIFKSYDTIVGHCDALATNSVRWLKWLGATFEKPDGRKLSFVIRKKIDG